MKHEKYWSVFFNNKAISEEDAAKRLTFSSEANRQSIYEAIQSFIHGHFDKVLDAGVGMGDLCLQFKPQSNLTIAIDISFEMLKSMQNDVLSVEDKIGLCQASVINPPFREACFDLILACEVLQYVPFNPAVSRLVALLRPKGILVISIPHKAHPAVMQAHLRRDKMYNGIGIEELKLLSDLGGVVCRFMPLYLADNVDKQYVRGEIKKKPSISDIEGANRFIIKLEKIS
ncbi:MAG: class I SAM-dependent methyltransferase [Deltaproteobacteria bacterium]|nr:class I SAM-dependent methyltransferase [Deltaproteobacteria bacterium]MBW2333676.1 class I SAM-dependent methyltransferase [Deltaproteobacteria bacterium]